MEKVDIINGFIAKNGYTTYLEIGVSIPDLNYDKIVCEHKEGCDPYENVGGTDDFNFNLGVDVTLEELKEKITYCMRSDEMFRQMDPNKKYDAIFIDGYHSERQSKIDIVNSLEHLSENGVIFVHDCMPRNEICALEERIMNEWFGCVYKTILDFKKVGGRFAVIDELAVIPYQSFSEEQKNEFLKESTVVWSDYDTDRDSVMRVIDYIQYGGKIAIYHNSERLKKSPVYNINGDLAFGGTEYWVYGIAEELYKRCFDVTVYTDVRPSGYNGGVKYRGRADNDEMFTKFFDNVIITTDVELSEKFNCGNLIVAPTCEYFNTFVKKTICFDRMATLSDYQEAQFNEVYGTGRNWMFRHFLPAANEFYKDSDSYHKENAMVWSSAPVRGLRFFIERVMPKIKYVFPDFKLYVCGYTSDGYETDWPHNVNGVLPIVNADRKYLSELQKRSKIWVYPNIGRSATSGHFYETYCITAVENVLAGNAVVCLDKKDGISSTLEGYSGFIDGDIIDENSSNFFIDYERVADILALQALKILANDDYRAALVSEAREICKKYTWDNEARIIVTHLL